MKLNKKIIAADAVEYIGAFPSARLVREGWGVTGHDSVNAYYDPGIKEDCVRMVEATAGESSGSLLLVRRDLADAALVEQIFAEGEFDAVVKLAVQAGVRYSIVNPRGYIDSNFSGSATCSRPAGTTRSRTSSKPARASSTAVT